MNADEFIRELRRMAENSRSKHDALVASADLHESQQARIAELEQQLAESRWQEQGTVEQITDFIVEQGDCLRIALDTQDRDYLERILRQWRGPQEAGEGGQNEK